MCRFSWLQAVGRFCFAVLFLLRPCWRRKLTNCPKSLRLNRGSIVWLCRSVHSRALAISQCVVMMMMMMMTWKSCRKMCTLVYMWCVKRVNTLSRRTFTCTIAACHPYRVLETWAQLSNTTQKMQPNCTHSITRVAYRQLHLPDGARTHTQAEEEN